MVNYIIIICSKCGSYLLAKSDQKSRACPYCGSSVYVEKARKVAYAETANEASIILRRLKEEARLQRRF